MENKNLPAFPDPQRASKQSFSNQSPWDSPMGLTKREWFAGMALQGMLAGEYDIKGYAKSSIDTLAHDAVLFADALLTQLEKTQP